MTSSTLTWLVIADASKARLYSCHKAKIFIEGAKTDDLHFLAEFSHVESRLKQAELVADKMGSFMGPFGTTRFEPTTPPHLQEADQFAYELVHVLEQGRLRQEFKDIILVAPPAFMGLLLKHFPHELKKYPLTQIEKDYTQLNEKEMLKALLNHL
ncbi:MAG: host attachment protein [Gammaproteobacteria bacterium]|nr:host attachment protein [Gammaproteobacteria bacterium]